MTQFSSLSGDVLLDYVRAEYGNRHLLSFSTGKDSLAAWLWLREKGFDLVPFFMYLIPGLSYVERALSFYEEFFGQHIIRLPHPHLYENLCEENFQEPSSVAPLRKFGLVRFGLGDVEELLSDDLKLPDTALSAVGFRAADSLERRRMIKQLGIFGITRRFFYPIWDWTLSDVVSILRRYRCPIPTEYRLFGRTPVAMNYRRITPIRDRFPQDWDTIAAWFPLIGAELFRYEGIGND